MSGVLQVSEATHREDFVKTPNQSGVTWTFAADDDLNGPSPCRPNLKSPTYNWLSNSRSQESEDSGVKSSSQNEDEPPISPTSTSSDDVKKKRSILRKMSNISGVSLRSSPSTPLFDFPTFDELFETEGKQHMKLSMHQSKSGFLRQQSYPGPAVSVLDENADDMEASLTQAEESRRSFKRQDSVLSQNFSSMVYRSWKGSKGFRGYRERLQIWKYSLHWTLPLGWDISLLLWCCLLHKLFGWNSGVLLPDCGWCPLGFCVSHPRHGMDKTRRWLCRTRGKSRIRIILDFFAGFQNPFNSFGDICMCLPISFIRHGLVGKNLQIRVLRPTGWSGVRMDILRCCDISASVCIFHSVLDCPNIRTKIWFKCHNVKTICIQKTIVLRDLYYTGT